ncbi:hypothetical protein MATL_G00237250 [Megalops atlanticus]|uniref:Mediator of RNA polymerase II transcription subunit 26 n=1 Tax=Megalops atlanticus TaxID=7932 RepID=A0A9D3PE52_MEGAT|nr:hypothetical protein MATL_G00237250 [Megalops atlanticus]
MTAASATPQQMRDRLLQAIDSQSNQIRNMVAVLEVISSLEKYPITKEALEETRLGKLINDVRKKTKDEDLAKRAKKLLRNWQKLIEPGQPEAPPRGAGAALGSANGGAHPCRVDATPPALSPAGKPAPELKSRNDVHNTYSPKAEKSSSRKRKGEPRDAGVPPKIPKTAAYERMHNSTPPPTNGIGGSPETPPAPPELDGFLPPERGRPEHLENDKHGRIPINAVRPHPSSPGLRLPSTSSLLKTAVLQQHAKMEEAGGGGPYQPRSPRCASFSPRSSKPEAAARSPASYAPRGTLPSPCASSRLADGPAGVPSPSTSPAQEGHGDSAPQHSAGTPPAPPLHAGSPHASECAEVLGRGLPSEARPESDGATSGSEGKRRKKKYRPRDYTVNLGGQAAEERTKPVRLKERRLTFDPVTGQIKPLTHKESYQEEEPQGPVLPAPRTEPPPGAPLPSPFQQTNWKELSRNEIIQFYLNLQSNVLTSSGAQTPGAHFFMTEYLKREEHNIKEARKTHVLVPDSSGADLPGVSRELTPDDLHRISNEHWPGVNGCCTTPRATGTTGHSAYP